VIHIESDVFTYLPDMDMSKETFVVTDVQDAGPVLMALQRAAERFLSVAETGVEHTDEASLHAASSADLDTPNYVSDPELTDQGVQMYVDCKGVVAEPMAVKLR